MNWKWFVSEIGQGETIPKLHGIADRRFHTNRALTLLVPFHLIYRIALSFWWALKKGDTLWWEQRK